MSVTGPKKLNSKESSAKINVLLGRELQPNSQMLLWSYYTPFDGLHGFDDSHCRPICLTLAKICEESTKSFSTFKN
jgi:hypothetical protein